MAGDRPTGSAGPLRTAYDLRHRYSWLNQFTDDELRKISLSDEHTPLQDGAQYFDVSHPERGPIVGRQGQRAPEGSCYVPRNQVSERTWDKLVGYGRTREAGR